MMSGWTLQGRNCALSVLPDSLEVCRFGLPKFRTLASLCCFVLCGGNEKVPEVLGEMQSCSEIWGPFWFPCFPAESAARQEGFGNVVKSGSDKLK